jgi:hypothetical protein
MEYYSVPSGNEVLVPATTWINFDNTTVNEEGNTKGNPPCNSTYTQYPE